MTAIYTFDVFTTLDGFGSYNEHGDWGGYWGKAVPSWTTAASPSTTRRSGWSSGHHLPGVRARCWARAPRGPRSTRGSPG